MKVRTGGSFALAAGLLALALPAPVFAGGYGGHDRDRGDSHYDSGHSYGHKRDCERHERSDRRCDCPTPAAPSVPAPAQTQTQVQTVYVTVYVYQPATKTVKKVRKAVRKPVAKKKVKRPRKVHRRTCRRGSFIVRCNKPRVPTTFRG